VHIWKSIHQKFPDWKVKIFGDGDDVTIQKLKNIIIELQLQDSFLLFPSTDKIAEEMQKASIYAMTSQTECSPMVLLEAQKYGLPIVSYDCPNGPRNIINNNQDGFLIENYNREMFSKNMADLIESTNLFESFSKKAKENSKCFDKKLIMNQWNNLFLSFKR
jgi:glycosyltransferase involved in cell wall biosynthesis